MPGALVAAVEVGRVRNGDVRIAVEQRGERSGPTIVLVHGYPDQRGVWSLVAEQLEQRYHLVLYDARGAGQSSAPRQARDYRMHHLAGDFAAVLDAVAPDRRVHLVGHDWGSIAGWEMLADTRTADRIASYTSISGPPLDHMGLWLRRRLRRPSRSGLRAVASQTLRSSYMLALGVPGLVERAWPLVLAARWESLVSAVERAQTDDRWPGPTQASDGGNGAKLYRANVAQRVSRPRIRSQISTPVLIVRARAERFIHPTAYEGITELYPRAEIRDIDGGHWVPRTQPELLSSWIAEHVDAHER